MDKEIEQNLANAKAYHDKIAKRYDEPIYNEVISYDDLLNYITDEITWRYLEKYLPTKGLVLDAAGGTARWAIPIARKGLDVILVDISNGMLDVARKKIAKYGLQHRITLKLGDIHRLAYPSNYFDFALAMGIEYCPNLDKVVSELARVLKPGRYLEFNADGLLFVTWAFLNEKNLEGALDVLKQRKYFDDENVYCWVYTPSQFRRICEKNNLKVEKIIGGGVCAYIKDPAYRREIFSNKKKLEKLLQIELALCETEDMAILSNHPTVIARKE